MCGRLLRNLAVSARRRCFCSHARYWVDLKSPESISLIGGHLVLPGAYVFSCNGLSYGVRQVGGLRKAQPEQVIRAVLLCRGFVVATVAFCAEFSWSCSWTYDALPASSRSPLGTTYGALSCVWPHGARLEPKG